MVNKCIKFYFVALMVATCSLAVAFGQANSGESGAKSVSKDREKTLRLPQSDIHYRETSSYIEEQPDADYRHASPEAYEAFRDIKYSIRIHWGVYSMWNVEASWPLLNVSNEQKQEYQNLYKSFNPNGFNAEEWMKFFERCGMQAFAFTTKHHDGFAMWHTKTRVKQRANFLNPPDQVIEPCDIAYILVSVDI